METEVGSREVSLDKFCDSTLLGSVCSWSGGTESESCNGSFEWQHVKGADGLASCTGQVNLKMEEFE